MCVQTLLLFGEAVSKVPEYYLDILIVATLFSMIQSPYFLIQCVVSFTDSLQQVPLDVSRG